MSRTRKSVAVSLLGLALSLAAPAQAQSVAITGGKVVTNTGAGVIENATVVISNGRIVSVGTAAPPAGASIVDATGKWVTPGLFAAFSRVGLTEISGEDSANDTSASGSKFQASLRAADSFNPTVTAMAVTRIEGVTRLALAGSPSGGLLGGYGALADTTGAFGSLDGGDAFMFARLGEAGASLGGGSRAASWTWLLAAIEDAKSYPRAYVDEKEGEVLLKRDAAAFAPVVAGRTPLMIEAHSAADILKVLTLRQREPRMKLILLGATEGWRVADQIAAANVPVIVDPMANLPDRIEILGATRENAARLHAAGVAVSIASPGDATHNSRWIPQLAGNAVANGLPWDAAFAAITRNPAMIYGRADLGVLQAGATADVVVWDGDPLELMSSPDAVYIDGAPTDMTSRQTRLRDRYLNLEEPGLPTHYRR